MRKKLYTLLILLCCAVSLEGCTKSIPSSEFWGSYTSDKTYSYDHKLYAVQTVEDQFIVVTIYEADTNEMVDSFSPARSMDFWGICWEKDSYNIWTQSADIGDCCFEYRNGKWVCNEDLITPEYIISKYDKEYRDNSELQKHIYKSPTE